MPKIDDSHMIKHRLIFIPDRDYESLEKALGPSERHEVLKQKGVRNFSPKEGEAIYIPDSHRAFLTQKARSGEQL